MQIRRLNPGLAVGPQIVPAEVEVLAALGFRSILVNRPDGEQPGQPTFEAIAEAARKQGMAVRHLPISPGRIGAQEVREFEVALRELPEPIYAHCRTGMRSIALWALVNPDCLTVEDRIKVAADNGYDLSALRQRLHDLTTFSGN